jgi:hypothetical protein
MDVVLKEEMEQTEFLERFFEGIIITHRVNEPLVLTAEETAELEAKQAIFTDLTADHSLYLAQEASNREREEWNILHDITLTYGEAVRLTQDFISLGEILMTVKARYGNKLTGGVFYDLGSVRGK